MKRVGVALAALLALVACTPDTGRLEVSASSPARPTQAPASEAPATQAPSSEDPAEPPSASAAACSEQRLAAIDDVVGRQLEAFRDGDFEAALALATDGFRGGFTPERFEQVMTEGFAGVLVSDRHELAQCVGAGGQALALVRVSGPGGTLGLLYDLRREDGRWRINGASPHTGDPAATPSEPETI
ncbi:MAG: DUF4864 domain-containing protein [Actinomycetota bacterium]|nr:DUF4864 domain-containing protein [Actinomycetota bacterium]